MNGNPTLSKDRLTKVRNGVYFSRDERAPKKGVPIGFGIGSDCVVLFEREFIAVVEHTTRKGVSQSTKHDVSYGTWYIGRVQIIRKKDGNRVFITLSTVIFWIGMKVIIFNVVGTIE